MSLFDFGAPEFGLYDAKIAVLDTSDDTYATAVDVPSVQALMGDLQTVNDQLEGDDKITDTHANVISAQVSLRFGTVDLDVLDVLMNDDREDSGSEPNQYSKLDIGDGSKFQYFGLCGKINATQGGGDTHVWFPKVKVMEGFSIGFEYGQYSIPELSCQAIVDANGTLMKIIRHETAEAITIPPTY